MPMTESLVWIVERSTIRGERTEVARCATEPVAEATAYDLWLAELATADPDDKVRFDTRAIRDDSDL